MSSRRQSLSPARRAAGGVAEPVVRPSTHRGSWTAAWREQEPVPGPVGRRAGRATAARGRVRVDIEGMRAVAVLAVVLYHAGVRTLGGGFVGVDVFFVLSGFLITGLLWREVGERGRLSFAAFYARRARRLLPATVLVLVVTTAVAVQVLPPLQARSVTSDAAAAALYVVNYRLAAQRTDYLAASSAPSPLQHYWSLAVEEQFYLFWPLLLFVASLAWPRSRRSRRPSVATAGTVLALVLAGSLATSVRLTDVSQPDAFFWLPTRAWEFAAGGLVALAAPALRGLRRTLAAPLGWLGLAAVLWAIVAFDSSTPFPGTAAIVPVAGTAAVLAVGCSSPRRGPALVLGRRPLQQVGRLSYSWYLWHWPPLVLMPAIIGRPLTLAQGLGLSAVAAVLVAATLVLVENPVRFSARLRARPGRGLRVGAALTGAGVAAVVLAAHTIPTLSGTGAVAAPARLPLPASVRPGGSPTMHRSGSGAADGPAAELTRLAAPVAATVARGLAVRAVPANLVPSLDGARGDRAAPFREGCDAGFSASSVGRCVYADAAASSSVALFGDSHAAQWFPAFERAATARHRRLEVLTKAICPPLSLALRRPDAGRPFRECDQFRASMLARLRAERPSLIVVSAARHYGPEYGFHVFGPEWIAGLRDMVVQLRATGAKVLVLSPLPHPKEDVPVCLSAHLTDVASCNQPLTEAVSPDGIRAEAAAVTAAGGSYLDVTPWLCTGTTCPVIVGNLLVYRDDNHLTTSYPTWLSPLVTVELDALLPPAPAAGRAGAEHRGRP